jgi:glycosyltransferase involved in cell wall biosynthesis
VDLSRFSPDGGCGKEPVVLLPRNLYRNRGLHLAMEAFSQLPTRFSDYSLYIVGGDGDAGYRQELEALAAKLSLGNRVVFRGPTAHEDMPREYRRASLTLIPSLCGEGTSLSALESMACGTPVVATRVGGLPDLPCALAEPESGALAAAITQSLDTLGDLGARQLGAVRRGFGLQQWAADWLKAIA